MLFLSCPQLHEWEPTIKNPYLGVVSWTVPENVEIEVTLFRDNKHAPYEDKDWHFVIEDVSGGEGVPGGFCFILN